MASCARIFVLLMSIVVPGGGDVPPETPTSPSINPSTSSAATICCDIDACVSIPMMPCAVKVLKKYSSEGQMWDSVPTAFMKKVCRQWRPCFGILFVR